MIVIHKPNKWRYVGTALIVAISGVAMAFSALADPASAQVAGANGRILYSSSVVNAQGQLWTSNPDGSDAEHLTPTGRAFNGSWSPNGSKIVFDGEQGGEFGIFTINEDGTALTRVVAANAISEVRHPAWSPDGSKLVFSRIAVGGVNSWDIYTADADGSNEALLYSSPYQDLHPTWSPDGAKIAFTSFDPVLTVTARLVVMNADGSGADTLHTMPTGQFGPAGLDWHPGGELLAMSSGFRVDIVHLLAGVVIDFDSNAQSVGWSPDGTKLIYSSIQDSDNDIVISDITGSGLQVITRLGTQEFFPSWQPVNDTTAPVITVTTPVEGASYTQGAMVVADYACSDEMGGSGAATCVGDVADGSAIDTSSLGAKTFTVNTTDLAGNNATKVVNYSVVAAPVVFQFSGFKAPVDSLPTVNSVNAGRSIPVKFSLGGDRGLGIFATGSPSSQTIACASNSVVDGIEETNTANSGLTYDAASDTYNYVWKTEKAWAGTCRQLVLKFSDGSVQRANFKFTK